MFEIVEEALFEFLRDPHLAGSDLGRTYAHEAEFAVRQSRAVVVSRVHCDRRPEDAARHGPSLINIAEARCRIERWAGRVIRELFEALPVRIGAAQQTGRRVAGKVTAVLVDPALRAAFDSAGTPGFGTPQHVHARLQSHHVKLIDGKCSITALRAIRPAHQPLAGASRGVGQRRLHDLHKLGIPRGQLHFRIHLRKNTRPIFTTELIRA